MTPNLTEGRRQRDAGIAKTACKNSAWLELALSMLPRMKAAGFETCTGEGLRNWLLANGSAEPTSPHAWGALTNTAVRRKLLEDTGRSVQMEDPRSRARRTPLWRLTCRES